jgi:hypothetical protein
MVNRTGVLKRIAIDMMTLNIVDIIIFDNIHIIRTMDVLVAVIVHTHTTSIDDVANLVWILNMINIMNNVAHFAIAIVVLAFTISLD